MVAHPFRFQVGLLKKDQLKVLILVLNVCLFQMYVCFLWMYTNTCVLFNKWFWFWSWKSASFLWKSHWIKQLNEVAIPASISSHKVVMVTFYFENCCWNMPHMLEWTVISSSHTLFHYIFFLFGPIWQSNYQPGISSMTYIIKTRPLQIFSRHSYHIYLPIIYFLIKTITLRLLQRWYNSIEYRYQAADLLSSSWNMPRIDQNKQYPLCLSMVSPPQMPVPLKHM